jgi:uncharacterized membrane protein
VSAIARLQARHENEATPVERLTANLTAALGTPAAVLLLIALTAAWVGVNFVLGRFGYRVVDPPPFGWLQGVLAFTALCVTVLILTTQRLADRLSSHREQLTLELAILGEQKTAKVIAMLEEIRRDNPLLRDRRDSEAAAMGRPADPEAVLEAIVTAPSKGGDDAGE